MKAILHVETAAGAEEAWTLDFDFLERAALVNHITGPTGEELDVDGFWKRFGVTAPQLQDIAIESLIQERERVSG
jgi:hypothetical protein